MIEAAEGLLEPGDMGVEVALQAAIAEQPAPVVLGPEHVDELPAPGHQFAQGLGLRIGNRARRRAHGLREQRDDAGVEGVGLGELPSGPSEITDLAGIDDGHR